MAFREKALWASAVLTLLIWARYFWDFVATVRAGDLDLESAIGSFVGTVITLAVVLVIAEVAIAIAAGRAAELPADDREKAYAVAAYRPAYLTLITGVVVLMLASPVVLRLAEADRIALPAGAAPILFANALLLVTVVAELVHAGAQLIRYRHG